MATYFLFWEAPIQFHHPYPSVMLIQAECWYACY